MNIQNIIPENVDPIISNAILTLHGWYGPDAAPEGAKTQASLAFSVCKNLARYVATTHCGIRVEFEITDNEISERVFATDAEGLIHIVEVMSYPHDMLSDLPDMFISSLDYSSQEEAIMEAFSDQK